VLYMGGLVALGLVFVFGADIRGASRWIQLGSFSFQPSEFMKIVVILMVARHLHNDPKTEPRTLIDLMVPAGITLAPIAAVMAQPDLGTSLIYLLCAVTMLAMTKIHRQTLLGLGIAASVVGSVLWMYVMLPYQKARITSFLDPEHDVTGAGWHARQSITAIGNGGLTGEGFMQGTQNQFGYLPDQHSDFPFSVFAEDWGFIGALVLLALYGFVCVWAVHIASQAKDRFGAAVAIGVGAMIFWHALFNVGMAVGVLPVVGITLPLFSYGGSSVVTMLIGFGLLMNVSMRR
jgi:rod shape determining protein RodA